MISFESSPLLTTENTRGASMGGHLLRWLNALRRLTWRENVRLALCLAPVLVLFVAVYGGAIVRMLLLSVEAPNWSIRQYLALASDAHLWDVLGYTFGLAAGVTGITLVLSYPIALVMRRSSPRMQRLITVLLILPLWTSTLVRSYAWMVLLGRRGVLNETLMSMGLIDQPLFLLYNRTAVYIGLVHVMLPYMVFPIYSAMKQIDMRLVLAARSLGASRPIAMLCIFLPLTLPGVAVGSVLVFVTTLAFWVTPTLLGGLNDTTYVMVIESQVNVVSNWPFASAMSAVLLSLTLLILFLYQRLLGFGVIGAEASAQQQRGMRLVRICARILARGGAIAAALRRKKIWRSRARFGREGEAHRAPRNLVARTTTVLVLIYLLGPIAILFPLSFSAAPFMQFPPQAYSLRWYERYFTGSDWTDPTLVSFKVALITMVLATVFGTMAALVLVKARFRFRGALLAFLLSPLIVPPIVIAVSLYFQFAPLRLVGTVTGLVLAHLVLSVPFVIMVVMGAMQNFDYSLERAARSLGAGPIRTFRRIILPVIWPGILTATFFAFLASFDEVIVAVFLSGTTAATLPKRLLDATRHEFRPTIAAVSVLLILISVAIVVLADLAQQRLRKNKSQAGPPTD